MQLASLPASSLPRILSELGAVAAASFLIDWGGDVDCEGVG